MSVKMNNLLGDSAIIRRYGYERGPEGAGLLHIEFSNGATWAYAGVPESVVERMLMSESRGGFVRREVVAKYPGEKVD